MADPIFQQLRVRVVQAALASLGLDSAAAINLVLGTAAQESACRYLAQYPTGPALGFWQIEPATHDDLLTSTLVSQPKLATGLAALAAPGDRVDQLAWNLRYAAAVCRLLYWRAPRPLPEADDLVALSRYWKDFYNTPKGAGTPEEFQRNYLTHIGAPL